MKEMNKREQNFYTKWEKRRKNKWLYIFVNGVIYWALPLAIATVYFRSNFQIKNMELSELIIVVITYGIGGLGFGLRQFKLTDNIYLELNDDDEILKGVQILKAGEIWKYENLKIFEKEDEMLIIQNELFWFEEKAITSDHINECLNQVREDFRRLQKDKDFKEYSKTRKVKIQIYDNKGSNIPLHEKII